MNHLLEEEIDLAYELQDFKNFAVQNSLVDIDNYIWSISIMRRYSKHFLQLLCHSFEIKYSPYDNKHKLIKRLFNELLF